MLYVDLIECFKSSGRSLVGPPVISRILELTAAQRKLSSSELWKTRRNIGVRSKDPLCETGFSSHRLLLVGRSPSRAPFICPFYSYSFCILYICTYVPLHVYIYCLSLSFTRSLSWFFVHPHSALRSPT